MFFFFLGDQLVFGGLGIFFEAEDDFGEVFEFDDSDDDEDISVGQGVLGVVLEKDGVVLLIYLDFVFVIGKVFWEFRVFLFSGFWGYGEFRVGWKFQVFSDVCGRFVVFRKQEGKNRWEEVVFYCFFWESEIFSVFVVCGLFGFIVNGSGLVCVLDLVVFRVRVCVVFLFFCSFFQVIILVRGVGFQSCFFSSVMGSRRFWGRKGFDKVGVKWQFLDF